MVVVCVCVCGTTARAHPNGWLAIDPPCVLCASYGSSAPPATHAPIKTRSPFELVPLAQVRIGSVRAEGLELRQLLVMMFLLVPPRLLLLLVVVLRRRRLLVLLLLLLLPAHLVQHAAARWQLSWAV